MEGGGGSKMMVSCWVPNEVMLDILSRLPVKSLIRLKCASKSCYRLISHPFFQHIHHTRSQRSLCFFFRIGGFDYNWQERRFAQRFGSAGSGGMIRGKFIEKVDNPIKLVLPACRGLVCLATDTRIYLCNPASHTLVPLPPSPRPAPIAAFGFGYLPSINAFKVVCFQTFNTNLIHCSVFTLPLARPDGGTLRPPGPWRVLNQHSPYLVDQFSYPAFANDTIYWKINRRQGQGQSQSQSDGAYILSMNIKEEKFGVINQPSNWRESRERSTQVVELNGRLVLAETCASHVLLLMLADPHNSIWIKQCYVDIRGIDPIILGEIKCFSKGEIIFSSLANILFFYHVHNKTFRQLQLPFSVFECTAYSETLSFPGT